MEAATIKENSKIKGKWNRKRVRNFLLENVLIILIVVMILITAIVEPKFLTLTNFQNILSRFGALSVTSLGMCIVLVTGYLDLSIAGLISFCAVVAGALLEPFGTAAAIIAAIVVGGLGGLVTSSILLFVKAHRLDTAVFITYGMATVYNALALLVSGGSSTKIPDENQVFNVLGKGAVGIVPVSFLIFLGIAVVLHIYLGHTKAGRCIYMTGGNEVCAQLCGIDTKKAVTSAFVLIGVMSGLGAILAFSRQSLITPVMGKNYETNSLMCAVIGGTSMKGGRGSIPRTAFGVALVVILMNAMNILGLSSDLQDVVKGLVLIIAICMDATRQKWGETF
ncbi:MAG: ABC transporter permease [Bilifractor sp.]|jgi:ribose transport system permease protein